MGFLDKILKKSRSKSNNEKSVLKEIFHEKSLEEIWTIENETDFILELGQYVAKKCQYGDEVSALSAQERVFYITQSLEMEVNNGGFSQFFFNSSGDFSNELVEAFTSIGAVATATICHKAIAAFGCEIPSDRYKRVEMLDKLESDEFDEILGECDNAFYDYEDNLDELSYNFVMKNKANFT